MPDSPIADLLRLLSAQLLSGTARSLKNENMSLAELAAIHLLDRRPQMRVNTIADALALSMPAASRVVSGLVERGLVTRREDSEDRRAKVVSLTKRGRALIEALTVVLIEETAAALATADTPVTERISALFATMVDEGLAGPVSGGRKN
jgi:DNA-binding MarR family transcriptional regulator